MMKRILKAYNVFLLGTLLLMSGTVMAGEEPKVEKKKTYTKTHSVSKSDKISLTNQFGELKLNTWNKNEVKVDVTITAKANSDQRAQDILDRINIEDGKNGSGVFFKTKMKDDKNGKKKNNAEYKNEGFTIDYIVYLPSSNPLNISNSFGATIIPDYNGEADIESKFGSLTAGNLPNVKEVTVEFGEATIESIHDGKIVVKFSRAVVNKISGNIEAIFEHSSGTKLGVDNNVKSLNIKNNFSTVYIDVPKDLSANFDVRTNFGDFTNKTDFAIKKEEEDGDRHGPKFDNRYTGKSGNGSIAMKISSEFGKVIVGHNLTMNIEKEKKAAKEKKKSRSI
jgi:hypothetical protein